MFPNFGFKLTLLLCVSQIVFGGIIPRQLNSLLRSIQGVVRPAGGSRARVAAMLALMKQTTSTTSTTTSPSPSLSSPSRQDTAPQLDIAGLMAQMSQQSGSRKSLGFNPADVLGQLSISFDKKESNQFSGSGDLVAQFSGMLPMILSVAKPIMGSYKGTDGYGGFMTILQDAKQLFSNRDVVRQLNQFLDDLIVGDATGLSQTPPTPSDSSLNSLAQVAQNMESLFNVPQSRPKHLRGKSGSSVTLDSANEVPTDFTNDSVNQQSESEN